MRWFRGSETPESKETAKVNGGKRTSRHSTGFAEFIRSLPKDGKLSVLDLGPTSSANIGFLTGLGGRVHNEDILRASQDTSYVLRKEDGSELLDPQRFFAENLDYPEHTFDAILCWDIPDFLNEALVKPMVERIQKIMKPGGMLLAFFHTKESGPNFPYCRYHIVNSEVLELESKPDFQLQRVFNNRHIENLFKGFSSLKFFLARDHIREVLVVR
jgi:hypothetical protein